MFYSIKPAKFVGCNKLGRTEVSTQGIKLDNIVKNKLEKTLLALDSESPLELFFLNADLPISFDALVLRGQDSDQDIIQIVNNGRRIDLQRDVAGRKGDIGVSCSSQGDIVPVDTINIDFRDYNDNLTNRGIAWVYPGDPATMSILFNANVLKVAGAVTTIAEEAVAAVQTQLLAHLDK